MSGQPLLIEVIGGEKEKYSPDSEKKKNPSLGKFFGEALIYQGLKARWSQCLLSTINECVAEAASTSESKDKDVYASGIKLD